MPSGSIGFSRDEIARYRAHVICRGTQGGARASLSRWLRWLTRWSLGGYID